MAFRFYVYQGLDAAGVTDESRKKCLYSLLTLWMKITWKEDLVGQLVVSASVRGAARDAGVALAAHEVDALVYTCAAIGRARKQLDRGEIYCLDFHTWVRQYVQEQMK